MDYISFWTNFQKKIMGNEKIQKVLDDSINDTGKGRDKNSYVFNLRVEKSDVKRPYQIIALVNTRSAFISVDAYFKKKVKHGEEILQFFLDNRKKIENRVGHDLYVSDVNKGEVRLSLRKPVFEFDIDKSEEYYDWFINNLITIHDAFEGLRSEKGFYPERTA